MQRELARDGGATERGAEGSGRCMSRCVAVCTHMVYAVPSTAVRYDLPAPVWVYFDGILDSVRRWKRESTHFTAVVRTGHDAWARSNVTSYLGDATPPLVPGGAGGELAVALEIYSETTQLSTGHTAVGRCRSLDDVARRDSSGREAEGGRAGPWPSAWRRGPAVGRSKR